MERVCLTAFVGSLVICFSVQAKWIIGLSRNSGCTNYTLYTATARSDWEECKGLCVESGSNLVSIENPDVWNFLKNCIIIQSMKKREYFIGMTKDNYTEEWRWIANNSTVNTSLEYFMWATGQPSNDYHSKCAKIYTVDNTNYMYDDLKCKVRLENMGCICQMSLQCPDKQESTKRPTLLSQPHGSKGVPTVLTRDLVSLQTDKPLAPQRKSSVIPATSQMLPAKLTEKPVGVSPATKNNSHWISIVSTLLAVAVISILILILVYVVRKRWNHKNKGSPSIQRSADHNNILESSTELTGHVGLLQPEDQGLEPYKTLLESVKDYTYEVVDNANQKSRSNQGKVSTNEEGAEITHVQRPPDDATLIRKDHSVIAEAEKKQKRCGDNTKERIKRKDCAYAIFYVKTGDGTATICKERTLQGESLDATRTARRSFKNGRPEELANLSSFANVKEVTNSEAPDGQNSQSGGECKDCLCAYAFVDNANKKRKPPEMPPPYRGLLYGEMMHPPERNTSRIKSGSLPTVYTSVNQCQPVSRLPEENVDRTIGHNDELQ